MYVAAQPAPWIAIEITVSTALVVSVWLGFSSSAIWSYKGTGSENAKWLMGQGFNLCAMYSFKHLSVHNANIKLDWVSLLKRQADQEPRECPDKSQNTIFKELFYYGENVLPRNCFPSSLQCIAISKWAVLLMRPQLPKSTFPSWK